MTATDTAPLVAPPAPPRPPRTSPLAAAGLNVLAVTGTLVLTLVLVGVLLGMKPIVLVSGSMAPDMPAGSLAVTLPADARDVSVGEVVSVERPGMRVTHRVVADRPAAGDARAFTLQGDANEDPDPRPDVTARVDRVVWHAPVLGRVLVWTRQLIPGAVVGGVLVLLVTARRNRRTGRALGEG
jgi:signal peptidase I